MHKKRKLFLFLLAVFFISALLFKIQNSKIDQTQNPPPGLVELNIPKEKEYWSAEINSLGGEAAYQFFKDQYLKKYPKNIHYITHIFGEQLYKKEGLSGVTVCDGYFAYGCYHGFIISAIQDKGVEIVLQLSEECIRKNGPQETGCRHGIGHGLLEYLGGNQLQKALEICSTLQKVSPLGCTQGVFMEYNRPGMMGMSNQFLGLRKLEDEKKLLEPCSSLPEKFMISCYYEQSQWWVGVLQGDYKRIGTLCAGLGGKDVSKSCVLGVGVIAGQQTEYNIEKTISLCSQMPDVNSQVDCRSGAGWVFKVNPNFRDQAVQMCTDLKAGYMGKCLDNSISPDKVVS